MLRGTALEYLDSAVPPEIRDRLRAVLGDKRSRRETPKANAEVVAALLGSHESIQSRLLELRAKRAASGA